MITASVTIEAWKLPVFQRHLRQAGYVLEEICPLKSIETVVLLLDTPSFDALNKVLKAADAEAALTGRLQ